MNSNVPRNSNLASELHRNYLFKFKLVLSSVRSNSHMMAPRCANRLQQSCSVSTPAANMVKLYGFNPLWTMITTMFQEKPNIYHISEPIIRGFLPKLMLLCSHWFIQLCNETLQHFARFWRLFRSVMWSILVPFLSLFSFLPVLSWIFFNSG